MAAGVIPYLMFNGNCEEAFSTYEKLMGAKKDTLMRFRDAPMGPGETCPELLKDKIINMSFHLNGVLMMASDAPPDRYSKPAGFGMALRYDTVAEVQRVFNGLAEGGKVGMPLQETFYAHSFGMLTDRFGIPWMVIAQKRL
ncbi:MAG TPA: VOC family protein [Terriglobales bacterium]|nr:VOC family protein [Terriglobales bacterium]